MDRIHQKAWASVLRACGFGALAIATTMFGVVMMPVLAAKIGAAGTALMAMALFYKSINAPRQPYRTTELWLLLERHHGLPEEHAQRILMHVLRDCYTRCAKVTFGVAIALWVLGLSLDLAGM